MCQERLVIKINVMAKKEGHAAGCPKLLKERERRRREGGMEGGGEGCGSSKVTNFRFQS